MHVSQSQQKTLRADYYFRGARARARTRVNGVVLREDTGPCRVSPFFLPSVLQNEIFPTRENHASFTFRTVSYRFRTGFVQVLYILQLLFDSNLAIIPLTFGSINLDHFQQWIISNNIFLLFINVSNRLNRLDCGAIRTSNGY